VASNVPSTSDATSKPTCVSAADTARGVIDRVGQRRGLVPVVADHEREPLTLAWPNEPPILIGRGGSRHDDPRRQQRGGRRERSSHVVGTFRALAIASRPCGR
jgi:hypothetical protein